MALYSTTDMSNWLATILTLIVDKQVRMSVEKAKREANDAQFE